MKTKPDLDAGRCSVHRLVRLWEPLAPLQPNLEFFDGCRWVPSGIMTGTCSRAFDGRYRVRKPNAEVSRTEGEKTSPPEVLGSPSGYASFWGENSAASGTGGSTAEPSTACAE